MFTDLVRDLRGGEGARFLMDQYLVFRDDAPTGRPAQRLRRAPAGRGVDVVILLSCSTSVDTPTGSRLFALAACRERGSDRASAARRRAPLLRALEDKIDGSARAGRGDQRRSGRHRAAGPAPGTVGRQPARPVPDPLPIDHRDFIDGVGSWHQKFQVVRRTPDALGNRVVGYVGGIDINQNRLDTPGHHGRAWRPPDAGLATRRRRGPSTTCTPASPALPPPTSPARSSGAGPSTPAASHAAGARRRSSTSPSRRPRRPTPTRSRPSPPGTSCRSAAAATRPNPGGGSTPLPWSPTGRGDDPAGASSRRSSRRAEYIYIEDQYFTPPDEYIHALLEASLREPTLRLRDRDPDRRRTSSSATSAAGRCSSGCATTRLRPRLGRPDDRGAPGTPSGARRRRPDRQPGPAACCSEALGHRLGDAVVLGPRSRLPPDVPFWLWVEGERMLAVEQRDDVVVDGDAEPALPGPPRRRRRAALGRRTASARRGGAGHPGAGARASTCTPRRSSSTTSSSASAPATPTAAGSSTTARSPRSPSRSSSRQRRRTPRSPCVRRSGPSTSACRRRWDRALLADPVAAFDLFRRPTHVGNRMSSFEALGVTPELGFPSESTTWAEDARARSALTVADDLVPYVWNVLADPTTATDPRPGRRARARDGVSADERAADPPHPARRDDARRGRRAVAAQRLPARARAQSPAATTPRTTSRCSQYLNSVLSFAAVRPGVGRRPRRADRRGRDRAAPEPAAARAAPAARLRLRAAAQHARPTRRASSSPSPTPASRSWSRGCRWRSSCPTACSMPLRSEAEEDGRARACSTSSRPGRSSPGPTTRSRWCSASSRRRRCSGAPAGPAHRGGRGRRRARRADLDRAVPLQRAAVPRRARPRLAALPGADRRAHRARARAGVGPARDLAAGSASTAPALITVRTLDLDHSRDPLKQLVERFARRRRRGRVWSSCWRTSPCRSRPG